MKRFLLYIQVSITVAMLWSCDKKDNYPGGVLSSYIPILDLRDLYKGEDLTLSPDNMYGANSLAGMVVSDHSGGNIPPGLLVIEDARRLNNMRGISIDLGDAANQYVPGDSIHVAIEGATLTRKDGILMLINVQPGQISKISSGNPVTVKGVPASSILANPGNYESTLLAIVKGGFNPPPAENDVISGEKILNDGFGNIALHTDPSVSFANLKAPVMANYYGIVFNQENPDGTLTPKQYMRTKDDMVVLSSEIEIAPMVISAYIADPMGTDANNEYVQFLATEDIDFSKTPYAMVTTNNAGASTPTGLPKQGWATGGLRSYKINITSGKADKGTYFYVGGTTKRINSTNSTVLTDANWVKNYEYNQLPGEGFGDKTTNLLANSGNASGIAIFKGTEVTAESVPVDVIFIGTSGTLYDAGPPPVGYRITNTDWYDRINPLTLTEQLFYHNGSNTMSLKYTTPADQGYFYQLGGVYNHTLGRWTQARTQTNFTLTKTSQLGDIENDQSTKLEE